MKKRIALVANTLSGGGAEKTVSNLSRGLAGYYDVDIIVNETSPMDYSHSGHVISLNIPTNPANESKWHQLRIVIKRIHVLRHLKRKRKYAAVISFSDMCNLSNIFSGNRYGKNIISVRNSFQGEADASSIHRLSSKLLMPWCYKMADLTVACSKGIRDELTDRYALSMDKGRVIYNGLELSLIRKKAAESLERDIVTRMEGNRILVSIGRLTRQKGQCHLLNVVKLLKDSGVPVHLMLLGDGDLRDSLECQAKRLGISDDITFQGFVENPYTYMANADVVVMSSLYEGFSNVIIEALACEAAVVSTDHETGAREILAPDTDYRVKVKKRMELAKYGVLVPVPTEIGEGVQVGETLVEEAIMADAIRKILMNPELASHYKRAALERAEQLDIRSICAEWINIIEC